MATQEMSCPHSDKVSTCPACMIDLNAMTDKKSFVHSVQVAPNAYMVSPELASEIQRRADKAEVIGNISGIDIMVSNLLPIEVSDNGQEKA